MTTEQRGPDEAIKYLRQQTILAFHKKLREFYQCIKTHCDDFGGCEETPKLVCFRSLRQYPPVRCPLYDSGYFPLTVDEKFVKDVPLEINAMSTPREITEKHRRRFDRLLNDKTFRIERVRRKPPGDPSETIVS